MKCSRQSRYWSNVIVSAAAVSDGAEAASAGGQKAAARRVAVAARAYRVSEFMEVSPGTDVAVILLWNKPWTTRAQFALQPNRSRARVVVGWPASSVTSSCYVRLNRRCQAFMVNCALWTVWRIKPG